MVLLAMNGRDALARAHSTSLASAYPKGAVVAFERIFAGDLRQDVRNICCDSAWGTSSATWRQPYACGSLMKLPTTQACDRYHAPRPEGFVCKDPPGAGRGTFPCSEIGGHGRVESAPIAVALSCNRYVAEWAMGVPWRALVAYALGWGFDVPATWDRDTLRDIARRRASVGLDVRARVSASTMLARMTECASAELTDLQWSANAFAEAESTTMHHVQRIDSMRALGYGAANWSTRIELAGMRMAVLHPQGTAHALKAAFGEPRAKTGSTVDDRSRWAGWCVGWTVDPEYPHSRAIAWAVYVPGSRASTGAVELVRHELLALGKS